MKMPDRIDRAHEHAEGDGPKREAQPLDRHVARRRPTRWSERDERERPPQQQVLRSCGCGESTAKPM
jgi:hypothetical protein